MSDADPDDLDSLFALARRHRPDTSAAEYAFETRMLSRLRDRRPSADPTSIWASVSWRMAPFFAAAVIALTLWQANLATDANDAAAISSVTNPAAVLSGEVDE